MPVRGSRSPCLDAGSGGARGQPPDEQQAGRAKSSVPAPWSRTTGSSRRRRSSYIDPTVCFYIPFLSASVHRECNRNASLCVTVEGNIRVGGKHMKAWSVIGLLLGAAILATIPVSPQVTPRGIVLSVDQAQAILGHWRRVNLRVNRSA